MKATIKATGETIEVMQVYEKGESFYVRLDMLDTVEVRYHINELEFEGFETEGKFAETCLNGIKQDIVYDHDYWTKLEHQYAGIAMQGMLSNTSLITVLFDTTKDHDELLKEIMICSHEYARALVKKMKEDK